MKETAVKRKPSMVSFHLIQLLILPYDTPFIYVIGKKPNPLRVFLWGYEGNYCLP
jgi:hypothetical protein